MTKLSLEQFENGIAIYQDENLYKFTSDSIKLAKFAKIKSTDNVLDMCAGCGVVGFYAYSLSKFNKLYFNEIQPSLCDLIDKNIDLNNLQSKSVVLCKNLSELQVGEFDKPLDVILCNPPYFKVNGKINTDDNIAMCRHEISTNLSTIIHKASQLLKSTGRLYLVLPAERLSECVIELNNNGFELKRLNLRATNSSVSVGLLECVKNAKSGVKIAIDD